MVNCSSSFTPLVTWKGYNLPPLLSKQCQPLKASNCSKCKSLTRIKAKACLSIKWFHQPLKLVTAWGRTLTEPTNSDENPVELPNKWNLGSALLRNAIMDAQQKFKANDFPSYFLRWRLFKPFYSQNLTKTLDFHPFFRKKVLIWEFRSNIWLEATPWNFKATFDSRTRPLWMLADQFSIQPSSPYSSFSRTKIQKKRK